MKPEHFKNTKPLGSCGQCCHRCWILDQEGHICTKHAFTLPIPLEDYVCNDFANPAKPVRRSVLDILGESPNILDEPRTLVIKSRAIVIKDACIDSYSLTNGHNSTLDHIQGRIEGASKGTRYELEFEANNVLVEDV